MLTQTALERKVKRLLREGKSHQQAVDISSGRGGGRLILRVRGQRRSQWSAAEWLHQYFYNGRRIVRKLGNVADMSLKDAAAAYRESAELVLAGKDPKDEQRRQEIAASARGSVRDLLEAYITHLRDNGKTSWPGVENALITGKYAALASLGLERKAADVTPSDIQRILAVTHKRAPGMAAHLRAYLHGAFAFGIGREYDYTRPRQDVTFALGANPVSAIPRNAEAFKAGDRVLSLKELTLLWKAASTIFEERTGLVIRLLIASGGRRVQEVASARKGEFDLEAGLWTIPAERSKNRREHVTPITPRASELVTGLMELAEGSEYLVPNARDPHRPAPFCSIGRAITRFVQREKLEHFTPRDLRRTARTLLAEKGVEDHKLDRHLNHGLGGVGQKHYDRSQHMADKLSVMAAWDALLDKVLKGSQLAKVTNISSWRQVNGSA